MQKTVPAEQPMHVQKMLPAGIEPATLGLLDPRSNQLSYESYVWVQIYISYIMITFCVHVCVNQDFGASIPKWLRGLT